MFDADNLATQVQISKINDILNRDKSAYPPYGLYNDTLTKDKAEEWLREHTDNHFSEKYIPQNTDFDDEAKFLSQELYAMLNGDDKAIPSTITEQAPVITKAEQEKTNKKINFHHLGKVYLYYTNNADPEMIIKVKEFKNVKAIADYIGQKNYVVSSAYRQLMPLFLKDGYAYVYYKKMSSDDFLTIIENAKYNINPFPYTIGKYEKDTGKSICFYHSKTDLYADKDIFVSQQTINRAFTEAYTKGNNPTVDLCNFYWREYYIHEEILDTLPISKAIPVEKEEDIPVKDIEVQSPTLEKFITKDDTQLDITISDISEKTLIPKEKIEEVFYNILALLYQHNHIDRDEEIQRLKAKIQEQEKTIEEQRKIIRNITNMCQNIEKYSIKE